MSPYELDSTITETQLEIRSKNLLVNYVKSLFGEESAVKKPTLLDLKSLFRKKIEITAEPHFFGNAIASDAVTNALRTYFPWQDLRSLSQDEIIKAAEALGYTVYEGSESPYANFHLSADQFGILNFDESLATDFSTKTSLWQKIALRLRPNPKPLVISQFSGIKFQKKELYIPELKLHLTPGDQVAITVIGLNSIYSSGNNKAEIVQKIVDYLQFSMPPIQLPEKLTYVPLMELVPSKDHYTTLKSNIPWNKVDGIYFFESELPDNLKDVSNS